jgi:hypothetical protein
MVIVVLRVNIIWDPHTVWAIQGVVLVTVNSIKIFQATFPYAPVVLQHVLVVKEKQRLALKLLIVYVQIRLIFVLVQMVLQQPKRVVLQIVPPFARLAMMGTILVVHRVLHVRHGRVELESTERALNAAVLAPPTRKRAQIA